MFKYAFIAVACVAFPASGALGQTAVFTRSYEVSRAGANIHETLLAPANVASLKFVRALKLDTGDDPRIEAQPLYVPRLTISPGRTIDVVIVATMGNNVYAFDVSTGAQLWKKSLGTPIEPAFKSITAFGLRETEIDLYGTNLQWGILSTPVIDLETNTLYVVSWSSTTKKIADAVYKLHALNLATGAATKSPILIDGSVGAAHFLPNAQKQRAALLLVKAPQPGGGPARKTLIVSSGLTKETGAGHGWVIAFDVGTFRRTAAWVNTPTSQGGGIWQGNQGPAADAQGFIYLMTGNGHWNGSSDFSESFVKLQYSPPTTPTSDGTLKVVDWFTPFVDADRTLKDQDLGSGGAILPKAGLVAGAGKDGVLYVLNRSALGHRGKPQSAIFLTYFPGFATNPLNVNDLDGLAAPATHHLHGSPIAWDAAAGTMLFVWGENSPLRAWRLQSNGTVQFLAESMETASAFSTHPDAMPGGMLTLSAQGDKDGIVWGVVPIKSNWEGRNTEADANKEIVEGVLRAYDATSFGPKAPNGNATLKRLWESTTPGNPKPGDTRFTFDKFCPPVVADGRVLVATYDGRVLVYGR